MTKDNLTASFVALLVLGLGFYVCRDRTGLTSFYIASVVIGTLMLVVGGAILLKKIN